MEGGCLAGYDGGNGFDIRKMRQTRQICTPWRVHIRKHLARDKGGSTFRVALAGAEHRIRTRNTLRFRLCEQQCGPVVSEGSQPDQPNGAHPLPAKNIILLSIQNGMVIPADWSMEIILELLSPS
jgi:hypothetical protein